jgi:ParB-like chromosome segregation protein Spo0J
VSELKTVMLSDLTLDPGIQVRVKCDDDAVARYMESYRNNEPVPPVSALFDGKTYWVFDGFHRVHAARAADKVTLEVNADPGDRTAALEAALRSNMEPRGVPLRREDHTRRIDLLLGLHPDHSDRWIADQLAVSHTTVAVRRAKLEVGGQIDHHETRVGQNGVEQPASKPVQTSPTEDEIPGLDQIGPAVAAAPVEVADPAAAAAPAEVATEEDDQDGTPTVLSMVDAVGKPLPAQFQDKLLADFSRKSKVTDLTRKLSEVKSAIQAARKDADPIFADLNFSAVEAAILTARRFIADCKPYAVCPYCGGSGNAGNCRPCLGRGWLGKLKYVNAPESYK